jgi:transposase InsO family protein
VEFATLEYIDWSNNRRLHGEIGDVPPVEFEEAYDNGPEFIAKALQRWCRTRGSSTSHIEPGAPWQNPFVESYNGHLRKELLDLELLDSVLEAQVLIDDWREKYNTYRPHHSKSLRRSPPWPRIRAGSRPNTLRTTCAA